MAKRFNPLTGKVETYAIPPRGETGPAELSAEGLANAVWSALASEFNENGTMGELLNSAGGAASPTITADVVWSRAASSVTTTGSMGEQVKKAKTAAENAFAVSG